jgi:hypothetical protein
VLRAMKGRPKSSITSSNWSIRSFQPFIVT